MSYSDRYGDTRQKALTGGVVALIQGGLAVALVSGFAVTFTPHDPPPRLASKFFPTKPITPDKVDTPKTKKPPPPATSRTTVADPIVRVPDSPVVAVTPGPVVFPTFTTEPVASPAASATPEMPVARFTPKLAMPRGNMASWITTDDYPAADVRLGHTGTVRFRLAIDASGKVASCTITQSSGYETLDTATCRNVTRRARFEPARDGSGDSVNGKYEGVIRWVIPRD
ncbi:TonB-like protein [Novosphingobium sp. Rr 2-17]|uniref:energy transducer TonB n=1 Tax=Novosphingobium sp. Rr 2-17 TaxID=555793 RepID=UPI0002699174|nr:energy transducer TonB [Novosphingobium sp. Rr 2-17]EIZ80966.1 TonB-like protein [Novosphingobium sp. Rr 2-17]